MFLILSPVFTFHLPLITESTLNPLAYSRNRWIMLFRYSEYIDIITPTHQSMVSLCAVNLKFKIDAPAKSHETPSPLMGEGWGEGESNDISVGYAPPSLSPPTRGGDTRLFTKPSKFSIQNCAERYPDLAHYNARPDTVFFCGCLIDRGLLMGDHLHFHHLIVGRIPLCPIISVQVKYPVLGSRS